MTTELQSSPHQHHQGSHITSSHAAAVVVPDSVSQEQLQKFYQQKSLERNAQSTSAEMQAQGKYWNLIRDKEQSDIDLEKTSIGNVTANVMQGGASIAASSGSGMVGMAQHAGAIGGFAAVGAAAFGGSRDAEMKKKELLALYKPEISIELGIPHDELTLDHLEFYATRPGHEQIAHEINSIDQSMMRSATNSGVSLLGGVAAKLMLLNLIPAVATMGASLFITLPVSIVGGMIATTVAQRAIDDISGIKAGDSPHQKLIAMKDKLDNRVPPSPMDVFNVLLAGDKDLQDAVNIQAGEVWDELDERQQARVVAQYHPGLLAASEQLAYQISIGATLPTRVLTLDTAVLRDGGAAAVYQLTEADRMRDMGENVLGETIAEIQVPTNNIAPFERTATLMQPRQQVGAGINI